jgi:hypothetical protein
VGHREGRIEHLPGLGVNGNDIAHRGLPHGLDHRVGNVDLRGPVRLLELSLYQVEHADVPLVGHDELDIAAAVKHRGPGDNDVLAVFQSLHNADGDFLFNHFNGNRSIDESLTDHILDVFPDDLLPNIAIQSCRALVQIDNVTRTVGDEEAVIG